MSTDPFDTLRTFITESGASGKYFSLPALEKMAHGRMSRLPVSIRIVLESVLRNCDGKKITEEHVRQLANWDANAPRTDEIPFVVARVLLQDFTGVPLLCDLAAMRGAAQRMGKDPKVIEQPLSNQAPGCRNRQRRCAHRGNHFVHQYLKPRRPARRRSARKKGGGRGPYSQAACQDLARSWIAGGHRVLGKGRFATGTREAQLLSYRLRLHHVHRQCGSP